jgi:hypothetical protein
MLLKLARVTCFLRLGDFLDEFRVQHTHDQFRWNKGIDCRNQSLRMQMHRPRVFGEWHRALTETRPLTEGCRRLGRKRDHVPGRRLFWLFARSGEESLDNDVIPSQPDTGC